MDYGRLCTWCARGCETQRDCVSFDYKALGRLNLRHQNWFLESRFQSHIRARSCDRDECGVYSEVGRSEALELEFGSAKKLLCPACFSSTAGSAGEVSCQKDANRMKQKECHSMSRSRRYEDSGLLLLCWNRVRSLPSMRRWSQPLPESPRAKRLSNR